MTTGYQQQRPPAFTAAVRSTRSPQHAGRLKLDEARHAPAPLARDEEKSFDPNAKR